MSALINFSGIASGIDSSALIKAIIDQDRAVRVSPLQKLVSSTTDTNSSYSKLKDLLSKLNTATQNLREVNGSGLEKNAASSDETIATATASSSATNGSYTINVTQLAKNANFSFNDRFSSSSSVIAAGINNADTAGNRTVNFQIGTGSEQENVAVVLTNTTSLDDFVSLFNANSTKATASVVNVGTSSSPSYAISVVSNNQGTDKGQIAVSVGSAVSAAGVFGVNTLSQATNATFTLTGVSGTITKSSNSISDVVPGLTLDLKSTGSATLTVSDDVAGTTSNISDFVNAYNDVINYIKENDAVTREEEGSSVNNIFGPLAGTSLDESLVGSLRSALSQANISGTTINTLSDLGISTQRDGTLKFDSSELSKAVSSNPESVRTITQNLGEILGAVDDTLAQYTRFNGLIDSASNANTDKISNLNTRIGEIESSLSKKEQSLTARFARLESLLGQLGSQQSALSQTLPR